MAIKAAVFRVCVKAAVIIIIVVVAVVLFLLLFTLMHFIVDSISLASPACAPEL